ncbi:helix-turn-helix transcriptional regulator [Aquincola sp. S2]|uniref:Helix-turn-helix transcriptional regulator n=1 Tax=Pseudaquabacterium terrae TaxID=2732868 RepID=A0ABX2EM77_9BURK|nr:XRE family transcriptional regulator [Aquabacterium terrae]NRF69767.1 helix-turn-helix transcriptional regulator [Aquabacterium terrae]
MKDESPDDRDVHRRIARRVRDLRAERGQSLDALAAHCGVSRSMISLIERGEASPTAVVLEKLATGLGVMLADLFAAPHGEPTPLAPRREQAEWRDPQSGYLRRNLSPPAFPSPIQLVEVEFPAGARVAYESGPRDVAVHQQIWLIAGSLEITLGDAVHALAVGDCLAMRLDRPIVFANPGRQAARYLVAITAENHAPATRRTA